MLNTAIKHPRVRKAPGGNINNNVLNVAGKKANPNTLPAPRISLTAPRIVSAIVNPRPIAKPSTSDGNGLFLHAKDSALASIKQLTTIRGI